MFYAHQETCPVDQKKCVCDDCVKPNICLGVVRLDGEHEFYVRLTPHKYYLYFQKLELLELSFV